MRFDEKTVVVTGGALGIGGAASELFAERGANVAILDWDEKGGNETRERIEAAGGRAAFHKVDVADFGAVENAVREAHGVPAEPYLSARTFFSTEEFEFRV